MDYGGAAEAAPFQGKLHAPFQSKLKLTHFADPHKWLTWGGGWAILEARAVSRLHVLGESCPDNAAGWDNRSGFTGSGFQSRRPETPTYPGDVRLPGGSAIGRLIRELCFGSVLILVCPFCLGSIKFQVPRGERGGGW